MKGEDIKEEIVEKTGEAKGVKRNLISIAHQGTTIKTSGAVRVLNDTINFSKNINSCVIAGETI